MAERNISIASINRTIRRGYAFQQTFDKYLIISKEAAVVITSQGHVITVWGAQNFDSNIISVISQIFGF